MPHSPYPCGEGTSPPGRTLNGGWGEPALLPLLNMRGLGPRWGGPERQSFLSYPGSGHRKGPAHRLHCPCCPRCPWLGSPVVGRTGHLEGREDTGHPVGLPPPLRLHPGAPHRRRGASPHPNGVPNEGCRMPGGPQTEVGPSGAEPWALIRRGGLWEPTSPSMQCVASVQLPACPG